jgi:hypothetical protein
MTGKTKIVFAIVYRVRNAGIGPATLRVALPLVGLTAAHRLPRAIGRLPNGPDFTG